MPKRDDNPMDDYCPGCGAFAGGDSVCPNCGATLYDDSGLEEYDEDEGEPEGGGDVGGGGDEEEEGYKH